MERRWRTQAAASRRCVDPGLQRYFIGRSIIIRSRFTTPFVFPRLECAQETRVKRRSVRFGESVFEHNF